MAIVSPFAGNPALGDPLEYGVYLVSAVLLPIGGGLWALLERSRWSTVIMGVVALSLAVMIWRMQVIWTTRCTAERLSLRGGRHVSAVP